MSSPTHVSEYGLERTQRKKKERKKERKKEKEHSSGLLCLTLHASEETPAPIPDRKHFIRRYQGN
jgi:hypothetical protein